MPISLASRSEALALESSYLLDREQLLADLKTTLHLRTQLTNHGQPISLDRIQSPVLILKAELLGGITTERVIADPLPLALTNEIPILIPSDLLSLTLTLSGTVTSATSGETETLSVSETFRLNGALQTDRIATALFSPTENGHRMFLRGRNGEPLHDRPINLELFHELYKKSVNVSLRTDAAGMINLGALTGITTLKATSPDIATTSYTPPARKLDLPTEINIPAGTELRIPLHTLTEKLDPAQISFFQFIKSGNDEVELTNNLFSSLTTADQHLLISGLTPGTYILQQGEDAETQITVLPADSVRERLLVTEDNIIPLRNPASPTVSSTTIANDTLTIRVANASPETRVTVIAKRYHFENWEPGYAAFPFEPPALDGMIRGVRPSSYLTERRLSDEMRYILDRRKLATFPGSMLPRPGQLLHRWTPDDLDQEDQNSRDQMDGASRSAFGEGGGRSPSPLSKSRNRDSASDHPAVIDFLANGAATLVGIPLTDGTLEIPMAEFEGAQFIEIITADISASETTYLPLPPNETAVRDRRIARPLSPETHHLPTRFAAALAPGAEAKIQNLLDADWRAFTTLGETQQFLLATTGDDQIQAFAFLNTWPGLDEKEKLALLAEHHCHELHLFLSRKDPEFFAKHVKPFLIAKPEPQFIDEYLLARDLTKYLRPYAFSRLNAAEKALLAQALPARKTDISRELDLRWKTEAPTPDAETILFSQTLKGTDLSPTDSLGLARNRADFINPVLGLSENGVSSGIRSGDSAINRNSIDAMLNNPNRSFNPGSSGVAYITDKLRRIIIPRIDFEDTTVEEAIDFLRLRSIELDTLELDPDKKGMNILIRPHVPNTRIKELKLRNVPIAVALKYIGDATKLRYKVDDFAVTLIPQTETGEDLFTRTFRVPPDFAASLSAGASSIDSDPFADSSASDVETLTARSPISELLKQAGILLPEGASAHLSPSGQLLVTASPSELDMIEQLTDAFHSRSPDETNDDDSGMLSPLSLDDADPFACEAPRPRLFPDRTRLWLESNYYKHRGSTGENLIPLNRFWLELSAWMGNHHSPPRILMPAQIPQPMR